MTRDRFPEFFDASSVKTYLECPRKYYWQYVRHKVPFNEPTALSFGRAIHEGLYVWYTTWDEEQALNEFHKHWQDTSDEYLRTAERGENLLRGYFKKYNKKTEPLQFVTAPEQKFELDLDGHRLIGRFDGVVSWSGLTAILDHKTATRMGYTYYYQFRPDIQMSTYCFAASRLIGKPVLHAVINTLYFTKSKMDYDRDIITREPWEMDEYVRVMTSIMNEISNTDPEDMHAWRPNWNSCMMWGYCKYRDLCLCEDPEKIAEGMYVERHWNPLDD